MIVGLQSVVSMTLGVLVLDGPVLELRPRFEGSSWGIITSTGYLCLVAFRSSIMSLYPLNYMLC